VQDAARLRRDAVDAGAPVQRGSRGGGGGHWGSSAVEQEEAICGCGREG
jgi:hypothetical protein